MSETLTDISGTIEIDAPRDHVWRVLTEPEFVNQWLGCTQYENRVGHVFYMQQDSEKRAAGDITGATHCKILSLEKPKRFAFSWFLPGTPETHVEIRLSATDSGGTSAVLEHSGWDQFEPDEIRAIRDMLAGGWTSFVLPNLKRVAETE